MFNTVSYGVKSCKMIQVLRNGHWYLNPDLFIKF